MLLCWVAPSLMLLMCQWSWDPSTLRKRSWWRRMLTMVAPVILVLSSPLAANYSQQITICHTIVHLLRWPKMSSTCLSWDRSWPTASSPPQFQVTALVLQNRDTQCDALFSPRPLCVSTNLSVFAQHGDQTLQEHQGELSAEWNSSNSTRERPENHLTVQQV